MRAGGPYLAANAPRLDWYCPQANDRALRIIRCQFISRRHIGQIFAALHGELHENGKLVGARHPIRPRGFDRTPGPTTTPLHLAARGSELDVLRHGGEDRGREGGDIVGEDQAGGQQADDVPQLAVILRHQRIRRRHRAIRNSDIERAEGELGVVDRIAGQDHHRLFLRQPALQQGRADPSHRLQHLRVADRAPAALLVALGHEDAVGRGLCEMHQPVGDAHREIGQRRGRANVDGAVVLALGGDADVATLERLARLGRGSAYQVSSARELADVFLDDTNRIASRDTVEAEVVPQQVAFEALARIFSPCF